MRDRAILKTFFMSLLYTFQAPKNDPICVLSVGYTADLNASAILEAASSRPGMSIRPKVSIFLYKNDIWVLLM